MPLILKPEAHEEWLDPENKEPAKIEELMKTKYVKELKRHPVSKRVNRVENNLKECIEPLQGIGDSGSPESGLKKAWEKAYDGISRPGT